MDAFCAAKQPALKGIRGSKEGKVLCFGLALTAFVIKFRCVQLGLCEGCVSAFRKAKGNRHELKNER